MFVSLIDHRDMGGWIVGKQRHVNKKAMISFEWNCSSIELKKSSRPRKTLSHGFSIAFH